MEQVDRIDHMTINGEPLDLNIYTEGRRLIYEAKLPGRKPIWMYMDNDGEWDGDSEDKEIIRKISERVDRFDD